MKTLSNIGICMLGLLALAGCSTPLEPTVTWKTLEPYHIQTSEHVNPAVYIELANQARAEERGHYQLLAANGLVNHANLSYAKRLLKAAKTSIFLPEDVNRYQLVASKIDLFQQRPSQAIKRLRQLDPNQLTAEQRINYHQLLAEGNRQNGQIAAALDVDIALLHSLSDSAQAQQQTNAIWHRLQLSRLPSLSQSTSNDAAGWISLAALNQAALTEPNALSSALPQWQSSYPDHPANQLINPDSNPALRQPPTKIALLLPLQGHLAQSARAIRDGFMAASYQDQAHRPSIDLYDSTQGDIEQTYQEAVDHGANWVIGPLNKANVQTLADHGDLTVPTIALNRANDGSNRNLYQFSLSPEDEAKQAAIQARRDGYQHVLIIQQNNQWGERVAAAFKAQWTALDGKVADSMAIQAEPSLSDQIKQLLHIDSSEAHAKQLRQLSGSKIRFLPRRRQDIDVIFLAIGNQQARQVMPLLRYHFAGNIATYATSAIYKGNPTPYKDRDLNGIRFCDASWVLNQLSGNHSRQLTALQQTLKALWPKTYQQSNRFFALGVDAYQLIHQLNRLAMIRGSHYLAGSGDLTLEDNGLLKRQLRWAVMRKGTPHRFKVHHILAGEFTSLRPTRNDVA